MRAWLHLVLARLRGFVRPAGSDRDFDEELQAHLAMSIEEKIGRGMTSSEARRAARLELGGAAQVREAGRAARGLPWLDSFWLDLRLGLRMLRKSWGLTLVGGLAMTVVMTIAAGAFNFLGALSGGPVPLEEGDRLVALQTFNATDARTGPRPTAWADFARWRENAQSLVAVGAFRTVQRGMVFDARGPGTGAAEPVYLAEMTASGFDAARVPAFMGRPLLAEDEAADASPVVVISFDVWRSRFGADPAIVGRQVRIGADIHTIVGVMPGGFAFPVSHRYWIPLRRAETEAGNRPDPTVTVFARLAPGSSMARAQAELTSLDVLPDPMTRETGPQPQPRVVPYARAFLHIEPGWSALILLLVSLLLVPPCANMAILVYARTVTRQHEFAARHALGASRGRIVGQVFVEVLVLAIAAAAVALALVNIAGSQLLFAVSQSPGGTPFWMNFRVSSATLLYVGALAMLAAGIAGALPALQATGRLMQAGLRALGGTGLQLGRTWTALVALQVTLSVAIVPSAGEMAWGTVRSAVLGPGFAADEFLTARLAMESTDQPLEGAATAQNERAAVFGRLQALLVERLAAEPGVSAITIAAAAPGSESWLDVEVEGADAAETDMQVQAASVDAVYFDALDIGVLIGRTFEPGDFASVRRVALVDQTFVEQRLGSGNPLGRRIRHRTPRPSEPHAWHEIVGVVADLPANRDTGKIYHPMPPGDRHPATLILRVGSAAPTVVPRLRDLVASADGRLLVNDVQMLDDHYREAAFSGWLGTSGIATATLSVLLLSAAGLYALMSFTIAQRRREIGIRLALGAPPTRLLADIFRRAFAQILIGAAAGTGAALLLDGSVPIRELGGRDIPGILPAAAALMAIVGLFAAVGPARRGLGIPPTEALREG